MTFPQFYSEDFINETFGVISGTFLLSQFPNVPGKIAKLKTRSGNTGSFFIGPQATTGIFPLPWELDAGQETEWFDIKGNLNTLYQRGASGTTYLSYWVKG